MLMVGLFCGCEILDLDESEEFTDSQPEQDANIPGKTSDSGTTGDSGTTTSTDSSTTKPKVTSSPSSVPSDFAGVKWLHHNVSGWAQTASLSAGVSGSSMRVASSKANSWPTKTVGGTQVNANPWIFVYRSGTWYAATWEWLRPGQTSKAITSVHGSHIKKSPLNTFVPVSGEVYGFMVSGLARDKTRNVSERSNVVMVRWP